jgi:hypothetical protein
LARGGWGWYIASSESMYFGKRERKERVHGTRFGEQGSTLAPRACPVVVIACSVAYTLSHRQPPPPCAASSCVKPPPASPTLPRATRTALHACVRAQNGKKTCSRRKSRVFRHRNFPQVAFPCAQQPIQELREIILRGIN